MKDAAGSEKPLYLFTKLKNVASNNSVNFRSEKCTNLPNRTNDQLKEQYIENLGVI
jgi:hypothetical protein